MISWSSSLGTKTDLFLSFVEAALSIVLNDLAVRPCFPITFPRSVLSTFWRKPNHSFEPFEYGQYIPDDQAKHPRWPEYIAEKDAYPKTTYLWTGGGWIMPEKRPVHVEPGYSDQFKKLGGKSMKTKNIRSATPRGFAIANFLANSAYGLLK